MQANITDYPIGGREYVSSLPHISYPYLVILSLASVIGTAGNFAVIGAIIVNSNLHRPKVVYMLNLAVADLWVTAVADQISLLGSCHIDQSLKTISQIA